MKKLVFGLICGSLLVFGAIPFIDADLRPEGTGSLNFVNYDHRDLVVVFETSSGEIVIDFFWDDAPNHAENFMSLADSGFYNDTFFHRIIPNFMIQGGDPNTIKTSESSNSEYGTPDYYSDAPASSWGVGGPSYFIDAEFNTLEHDRGMVSMARSQDPNSAGSQFFIVHQDSNFLDGEYTVFGRIVTQKSFDTLDRIANVSLNGENPKNPEQTRIQNVEVLQRDDITEYLPLSPPERIGIEIESNKFSGQDQIYKSLNHGIQFQIPSGWTVQEPPKTDERSPDIIVLGPRHNGIPDSLTVTIKETQGLTFEQLKTEKINTLQPQIDQGSLDLKIHQSDQVNGRDVFSLYAEGFFVKKSPDEFTPDETLSIAFAEVLIYDTPKYYTFSTSSANHDKFDEQAHNIELAVFSFQFLSDEQTLVGEGTNTSEVNEEGGGCLIATAAYGSEMAPQVQFLRELRDNTVLQTQVGTSFLTGFNQFYYSFSPAVADYERENPIFKEAVKVTLTPLLTSLTILNYVDIDTEQEMLGYGIGVILLNIGMYFVAPAAVIIAIKNRRK